MPLSQPPLKSPVDSWGFPYQPNFVDLPGPLTIEGEPTTQTIYYDDLNHNALAPRPRSPLHLNCAVPDVTFNPPSSVLGVSNDYTGTARTTLTDKDGNLFLEFACTGSGKVDRDDEGQPTNAESTCGPMVITRLQDNDRLINSMLYEFAAEIDSTPIVYISLYYIPLFGKYGPPPASGVEPSPAAIIQVKGYTARP